MTARAAIQASYADYRRVKGRKVLQLIFEVPLEMAPTVHEAFGEPLPDGSTWVAVARIGPPAAGPVLKGGKLAQQAGILCGKPAFSRFLSERHHNMWLNSCEEPKVLTREYCGIKSRAELDHNPEAASKFKNLVAEYEAWKLI